MTVRDIQKMRGGKVSYPTTHLERYQAAHDKSANLVSEVPCPFCSAGIGKPCQAS